MILEEANMDFKQKLYNIISEVNSFKDRQELFENCVSRKLNLSFERYNNNLEIAYEYLLSRSALKVLRNIGKEL